VVPEPDHRRGHPVGTGQGGDPGRGGGLVDGLRQDARGTVGRGAFEHGRGDDGREQLLGVGESEGVEHRLQL
jgi:hypothetical protein